MKKEKMKDSLDKDIEKIKVARMSKDERFFYYMFPLLKKIKVDISLRDFYLYDNEFMFNYDKDKHKLYYNHNFIYTSLRNTDGIIEQDITDLIIKYFIQKTKEDVLQLKIWHHSEIILTKKIFLNKGFQIN